ncbi:MAG: nucleotidyltransferase family protein [Candidatus Sphingomonas colombiensis]|nr:nucleotidyltransferase family protein [Sphingomonas sp.]WEK41806.1 MAG: nucleotidyltransferase family protein [Sphingomonas sp.]
MTGRGGVSREADLVALIAADDRRMAALAIVGSLGLADCWIGAGFVRDAVWDHLHGRPPAMPHGDVDVLYFDRGNLAHDNDAALERRLRIAAPELDWSVRNQARMHVRNGDRPYRSVRDAMRFWPETATAVAIRLAADGVIEVNAPFGLEDLYLLRLVPTETFVARKRAIFDKRITDKNWMARYPLLRAIQSDPPFSGV